MKKNINILIKNQKEEFDAYYKKLLKSILPKNELTKVMNYSAFNGGKRIRPFLIHFFAEIANVPRKSQLQLASAVESIHTYSLMHDDLPSMDNDDYRRGKLSAHKKFNEAQAILAGDSLHDLAFEILSDKQTHQDKEIRLELIKNLSICTGSKGLAGGQSLDLIYENKITSKNKIIKMYEMKTSALFSFCCSSTFIMGRKKIDEIKFSHNFGKIYGLIFQIIDDYLDEVGNFKKIGKTLGKDKKQGKSTLLRYLDKDEVIPYCIQMSSKFKNENKKYFNKWDNLNDILNFIINRNS